MFYFVDWKQTDSGTAPALPEGMSFALIAEPGGAETYGLFDIAVTGEAASALAIQAVSGDLELLLNSAEQYPPAIALARDQVGRLSGLTRAAFEEALASCLYDCLASQPESPFFLAAANRTQPGYKEAGGFYWIVDYRPACVGREISWVSRDYYVYQDALADFDCERKLLEERFPVPRR
jgi:hypothetical protein